MFYNYLFFRQSTFCCFATQILSSQNLIIPKNVKFLYFYVYIFMQPKMNNSLQGEFDMNDFMKYYMITEAARKNSNYRHSVRSTQCKYSQQSGSVLGSLGLLVGFEILNAAMPKVNNSYSKNRTRRKHF